MGDLIDGLNYNEKMVRQIRAAMRSEDRVYDALPVVGQDDYRMNVSAQGVPLFILQTLRGKWTFGVGGSAGYDSKVPRAEQDRRNTDRLVLLAASMTEAHDAYKEAEQGRQGTSLDAMKDELRRQRGF